MPRAGVGEVGPVSEAGGTARAVIHSRLMYAGNSVSTALHTLDRSTGPGDACRPADSVLSGTLCTARTEYAERASRLCRIRGRDVVLARARGTAYSEKVGLLGPILNAPSHSWDLAASALHSHHGDTAVAMKSKSRDRMT
jgi:hypothetical protein